MEGGQDAYERSVIEALKEGKEMGGRGFFGLGGEGEWVGALG